MSKLNQNHPLRNCILFLFFFIVVVYIYVIIFFGIPLPKQQFHSGWMKSNLVGHNGAGDAYPEDTIFALNIAVSKYQADIVEVDVQFSKDKQLVCIHDATLERTTNGSGLVASYTFEELKSLDAGYKYQEYRKKGITIPSLEEVIEWILPQKDLKLLIEMKPKATSDTIIEIHKMFLKYPTLYDRAIIIAFEPHALYKLRIIDPQVGCALIVADMLISRGCEHKVLPSFFCTTVKSIGIESVLDKAALKIGKEILPYLLGCGGLILAQNTTNYEEVTNFIQNGIYIDIWGIKDITILTEYWKIGASVAPDTLSKINRSN